MAHSAVAVLGDIHPPPNGRLSKRYALGSAYLVSACNGALTAVPGDTSEMGILLAAVLVASSVALWICEDAARRGRPLAHMTQCLCLFTWPAASLLYLVRSRGLAGLGWWVLNAIGLCVVSTLGAIIGFEVAWGGY